MGDEIAIVLGMKHHRVRYVRSAPTGSNAISRTAQRHFPVRTGGLITFLPHLQHSIFPVGPLVRNCRWGDLVAAINHVICRPEIGQVIAANGSSYWHPFGLACLPSRPAGESVPRA